MYTGEIQLEKIGGKSNIADGLTKHVDAKALAIHVEGIDLELRYGRHPEAPQATDTIVEVEWETVDKAEGGHIKGAGKTPSMHMPHTHNINYTRSVSTSNDISLRHNRNAIHSCHRLHNTNHDKTQ